MKIGIAGIGMVGSAVKAYFRKQHDVYCYDEPKGIGNIVDLCYQAEIIFICVPTPMDVDGKADLSIVIKLMDYFKIYAKHKTIVIKSTVPIGTTQSFDCPELNVVFNPEFLRERCNIDDMMNIKKVILGGENIDIVSRAYLEVNPDIQIVQMDSVEAEMVKYATNSILACQVAIANEIYNICQTLEIDYEKIKWELKEDDRIGSYLDVPGYDGKKGFGGTCFPKDLNALIAVARQYGYRSYLLEEVWRQNILNRKGLISEIQNGVK